MNIKKRKTEVPETWDLVINDTVVGSAYPTHKTRTQRIWQGSIDVPITGSENFTAEHTCDEPNGGSVKKVIDAFIAKMQGMQINVPATAPKVRKPRSTKAKVDYPEVLTRDMINTGNAVALGKHYGYSTEKKGGIERTGAEQAKYMRGLLDKAKKAASTPVAEEPAEAETAEAETAEA